MFLEIELGMSDSRGTLGRGRTYRGEMEIERGGKEKEESETEGVILPNVLEKHVSLKVRKII